MTTGSDEQRPTPLCATCGDHADSVIHDPRWHTPNYHRFDLAPSTLLTAPAPESLPVDPRRCVYVTETGPCLLDATSNPHITLVKHGGHPFTPPVGTDPPCVTCGHPHAAHVMDDDTCDDCEGFCHPPEPVGTDSARAEAERRYLPEAVAREIGDMATLMDEWRVHDSRLAFIAGAEWARAEERKARGD